MTIPGAALPFAPHGDLQLRLFGSADLSGGGAIDDVLRQPRRAAVLAVLTVESARGFVRRDRLTAMCWPDLDSSAARASLRQIVHAIRGALGADAVVSRGADELRIDPAVVWCDVLAFDGARAAGHHARALELYRGPLLEAFHAEVDELDRWLDDARATRAEGAVASAWSLARDFEETGDLTHAAHWARQVTRLAGTDERRIRAAMELFTRAGNRAEALRVFDNLSARLRRDFDVEPSEETRALAARLRAL